MTNKIKKTKLNTPPASKSTIVLYKEFKPRTKNQVEAVRSMVENDITIISGAAGTGKSFLAVSLALTHLHDGKINKIIIARPTIEASPRGIGFLKGTLQEKMDPYMTPIF